MSGPSGAMSAECTLPAVANEGEACVNCKHVAGVVLHWCACPQSEFYRGAVFWEGWCPNFKSSDAEPTR